MNGIPRPSWPATGTARRPSRFSADVVMENRNGLCVAVSVADANPATERTEAVRLLKTLRRRGVCRPTTVGGDMVAGRVRILIAAALVVAAVAIAFLPLIWVAIGLVLAASRVSIRAGSPESGLSGQSPATGRVTDSPSTA